MADKLSKNVQEKIANGVGELNSKIGRLIVSENIMQTFSAGTSNLDEIERNVNNLSERSAKVTSGMPYVNTAMTGGTATPLVRVPGITPSVPGAPTTPSGPGTILTGGGGSRK